MGGTPKLFIFMGLSLINHPAFLGYPHFGSPHFSSQILQDLNPLKSSQRPIVALSKSSMSRCKESSGKGGKGGAHSRPEPEGYASNMEVGQ